MDITYDLAFWRCLGGFYTGVIAAWVYGLLKSKNVENTKTMKWSVLETIILGLSLAFVIFCPGKQQFFVAPIAFIFVLVFAFDKGLISRFMSQLVFRYLAKISYSVYMIHVIISIFFAIFAEQIIARIMGPGWTPTALQGDIYLAVYLLVVIACAHITYHLIEVPGRKWMQKLDFSKIFRRLPKPVEADS